MYPRDAFIGTADCCRKPDIHQHEDQKQPCVWCSEHETLKLLAEYLRIRLVRGEDVVSGSAEACNLRELALRGLGEQVTWPQVPMKSIFRWFLDKVSQMSGRQG